MKKNKDYNDFLATKPVPVPSFLSHKLFEVVHIDLNPSAFVIFSKISLMHFFMGTITLFFCPQFGLSLTRHSALMHFFMQWGDFFCMLACGSFFVSFSLMLASLLLRPEELKVLKKHSLLQTTTLSTLSIGFFISLGAEVVFTMGLFWVIGSIIGGLFTLKISTFLREAFGTKAWL